MTERSPSSPADRRKNLARKKSDRRKADTGAKNAQAEGGQQTKQSDHKPDAPRVR